MQAKRGALHAASQPDHNKLATARPQMTFVSGEKKAPEKREAIFLVREKQICCTGNNLLFYFTLLFGIFYKSQDQV